MMTHILEPTHLSMSSGSLSATEVHLLHVNVLNPDLEEGVAMPLCTSGGISDLHEKNTAERILFIPEFSLAQEENSSRKERVPSKRCI